MQAYNHVHGQFEELIFMILREINAKTGTMTSKNIGCRMFYAGHQTQIDTSAS